MKRSPSTEDDIWIWGIHPVMEALATRSAHIHEIMVLSERPGQKLRQIIDQARHRNIRVRIGQGRLPTGSSQARHQNVFARIMPFATMSLDDLLKKIAAQTAPPFLVAADCILDPYNLGAIIRSALAAGVQGILVPRDRSAPLGGTVAKASAGAAAHLDLCRVTNLAESLQALKKQGVWVYGTAKEKAQPLYNVDLTGPVCLVIGGEEKGLRPRVRDMCDVLLTIPMHGGLDSLNASAAAAVVLFETARQRWRRSNDRTTTNSQVPDGG